jgi:succinate-semialdehyde dehydrogenase/glutarate-semialdehyde dehydrogenase
VFDDFADRFTKAVGELRVGPGTEEGVSIGPLINESAVTKVEHLVEDAVRDGAQVKLGGHRHALGATFYEPTVITETTPAMEIAQEEIFGPVATLFRFGSDEEGIALANDTPYGLASYFYARDIGRIMRVAEALEYGMVGVNEGIISSEMVPFGGVKESGLGREGSHEGLDEFLETKYILLGGLTD